MYTAKQMEYMHGIISSDFLSLRHFLNLFHENVNRTLSWEKPPVIEP